MDDISMASDSLSDLEVIAKESIDLMESRDLSCVSGLRIVALNQF